MPRAGSPRRWGARRHELRPLVPGNIVALIRDYPLAWVASRDLDATLLPLIVECDAHDRPVALVGHYPRRNPQVAAFERDVELFGDPHRRHAGIRPRRDRRRAATPRYPARTGGRLAARADGARFDQRARHVIAFRAHIVSCEPQFTLGQDESAATFAEIVAGHPNADLVAAMLRNRPSDPD